MRNTAEYRIGNDFISVWIVRKELHCIIKAHSLHFVYARCPAVKRIFLRKQLLFNKAHGTAAKHDHYIFVLEKLVPQVLQDRRDTLVSAAHIRELIYDKQFLFITVG